MTVDLNLANRRLEALVDLLDIPPSYYEMAKKRYESLGDWFHRSDSALAPYDPSVYPQGSFRLGTVIRPLLKTEEYDLDLVSEVNLSMGEVSQRKLKALVGREVVSYAESKGIEHPVEEKNRCWRLEYADTVHFHMDILPALPDDDSFKALLTDLGVPAAQAAHAVAITDVRDTRFSEIQDDWPRSNPKGFGLWFDGRMRDVAAPQLRSLVSKCVYASVDEVPAHEWKTPLQRCIQVLKRHRDVMFQDQPDLKPISMIITALAARAYEGEADIYTAMRQIIEGIPRFVGNAEPRVPNPVNPAEDFADKWRLDRRLEQNFWAWHEQVRADLDRLIAHANVGELVKMFRERFGVRVGEDRLRRLASPEISSGVAPAIATPTVRISSSPPEPWRRGWVEH